MPQDHVQLECRRRGKGENPHIGLVNGPVALNGCRAAATKTSEKTPADTWNRSKQQPVLNSYVKHCGYKDKSIEAAQQQGRRISALTAPAPAGDCSNGGVLGGMSVDEVSGPHPIAVAHTSDQETTEQSLPAVLKNKKRRKSFRRKRNREVPCQVKPPMLTQRQEENWENEIQDAVRPYGPKDVLPFHLRDLTLKRTNIDDLQVTADYQPAVHHPYPVQWHCHNIPTEPNQFADADE